MESEDGRPVEARDVVGAIMAASVERMGGGSSALSGAHAANLLRDYVRAEIERAIQDAMQQLGRLTSEFVSDLVRELQRGFNG